MKLFFFKMATMLAAIFKMADSRTCVSACLCVSNQTQIGLPQCGSFPSGQLLFPHWYYVITDCPLGKDPHCDFDYHPMFITLLTTSTSFVTKLCCEWSGLSLHCCWISKANPLSNTLHHAVPWQTHMQYIKGRCTWALSQNEQVYEVVSQSEPFG